MKGGTLDLLNSMRKIVKHSFPKAKRVIDRFQRLKLANDAVQQIWIDHCWVALQEANGEQENAKIKLFRANLRGIADRSFFLFRLAKLFIYPTEFLLDLFPPSIFMQLM